MSKEWFVEGTKSAETTELSRLIKEGIEKTKPTAKGAPATLVNGDIPHANGVDVAVNGASGL